MRIQSQSEATFPLMRMTLHLLLVLGVNLFTLIDRGFGEAPGGAVPWRILQLMVFAVLVGRAIYQLKHQTKLWSYLFQHWPRWVLLIGAFLPHIYALIVHHTPFHDPYYAITQAAFSLMLILAGLRWQLALTERFLAPNVQLLASFAMVIIIGAGLLMLPAARMPHATQLNPIDALFMATSATCVTGLSVTNLGHFSFFGKAVLISLIQIGALGIVFYGTLLAMMVGRKQSLREIFAEKQALSDDHADHLGSMTRFIFLFTLGIQLLGALGIWIVTYDGSKSLYGFSTALFMSISAFSNAGFTTGPDSLLAHQDNPWMLTVISLLIIFGGLGFPVWRNLTSVALHHFTARFRPQDHQAMGHRDQLTRISLHSKIAIGTTLILLLLGAVLMFGAQLSAYGPWQTVSTPYSPDEPLTGRVVYEEARDASFWSVTARTAGFNSAPTGELRENRSATLVMMVLMLIGGSPASTAGGLKTIAFFILIYSSYCLVRNRKHMHLGKRRIDPSLVRHGLALFVAMILIHGIATAALCITESQMLSSGDTRFYTSDLLFEVISATSTVGLTLGVTEYLSAPGRLIITLCMFLGRIGPLMAISLLSFWQLNRSKYRYPTEVVLLT